MRFLLPVSLVSLVVLLLLSFVAEDRGKAPEDVFVNTALLNLRQHIEQLNTDSQNYKAEKVTTKELQESLRKTRNSYKEIEFFIAYYYPDFTKNHMNAAPLYRLEAAGTSAYTLPPEGLQVLDELIFSVDTEKQRNEIAEIAGFLHNQYSRFYLSAMQNGLSSGTNKTLPLRMQLIRIFSMGVSGYDTPGSLNVSEEAQHSLSGILKHIESDSYFQNYDVSKARKILNEGMTWLSKNRDFNTLDRIEFYKKTIQPLYEELGSWDGRKDDLEEFSGWNSNSSHLFESGFLNPYFYTLLSKNEDGAELRKLGKTLFYDESLSGNSKMSCATCHLPEHAFTDLKAKSESNVEGKTVMRNSPTLYNSVFAKRFFYDMRAFYLEQQAEHVIYNEDEFNTTYESIVNKIRKKPEYRKAFRDVFGTSEINRQNFSKALSSYVASLYSFDSDFDNFMRNEKEVSEDVKKGFNLFMGKANCATCHFVPNFSGLVPPFFNENESEILGVTKASVNNPPYVLDDDRGRIASPVSKESSWIYEKSFKTTTVRNIELTAPYFHNGAFNTLEEVMDFYNEGGGEGLGLKVTNQTLSPDKLNLYDDEIKQIIAFMKALTDNSKSKE